jgi:hypothetical protein
MKLFFILSNEDRRWLWPLFASSVTSGELSNLLYDTDSGIDGQFGYVTPSYQGFGSVDVSYCMDGFRSIVCS